MRDFRMVVVPEIPWQDSRNQCVNTLSHLYQFRAYPGITQKQDAAFFGINAVSERREKGVEVRDTQRPVDGLIVHHGRVTRGEIHQNEIVQLDVDAMNRNAIVRNHSATHLLHAALREVLGPEAMQKGSLVSADRLRFDFTHDQGLTVDELEAIEDLANQWIAENHTSMTRLLSYNDAVEQGAMALFEEKYGDEVRVVSFGGCSTELCGGTHAGATGEIGLLKIVSESGISAGIRRIEALSGKVALQHIRAQERALRDTASLLNVATAEVTDRVSRLLEDRNERRQVEMDRARALIREGADSLDRGEVIQAEEFFREWDEELEALDPHGQRNEE